MAVAFELMVVMMIVAGTLGFILGRITAK